MDFVVLGRGLEPLIGVIALLHRRFYVQYSGHDSNGDHRTDFAPTRKRFGWATTTRSRMCRSRCTASEGALAR